MSHNAAAFARAEAAYLDPPEQECADHESLCFDCRESECGCTHEVDCDEPDDERPEWEDEARAAAREDRYE